MRPRPSHLQAALIERPGPVGDPLATLQGGCDAGVVLPPLELPEGTQVGVLIVQADLGGLH